MDFYNFVSSTYFEDEPELCNIFSYCINQSISYLISSGKYNKETAENFIIEKYNEIFNDLSNPNIYKSINNIFLTKKANNNL